MRKFAIIVAGGQGSRMGGSIPKQFMLLNGKPVLMHTLDAFFSIPEISIILVLPVAEKSTWNRLYKEFQYDKELQLVEGGESRFHSVRNGLAHVPDNCLVAIHDGVRPMVSKEMIEESFTQAEQWGNAIAAIPLKDSLREQTITGETRNVNRNNFYLVQTPQTFKSSVIKDAYKKAAHENFTDDAGVAEEAGYKIRIFIGDSKNIKLTSPEDLLIASVFLTR
jgi:2-C-methyl-D-erythritol 4-phosphate cytidylyltransferase